MKMGEERSLREERVFSWLCCISNSEAGPVSRGQTQDLMPLRLLLMDVSWNTLLVVEAMSPSQSCPLRSHVNKWIFPQTRRSLNTFQITLMRRPMWQLSLPLAMKLLMLRTHGMIWCPHLHLMLPILWCLRAVFVPGGLQRRQALPLIWEPGTLSEQLLPAERLVSNQMHWLKYLFPGKQTHARASMCMHTQPRLGWMTCKAGEVHWWVWAHSPDTLWTYPYPTWPQVCLPIENGLSTGAGPVGQGAGRGQAWSASEPLTWRNWQQLSNSGESFSPPVKGPLSKEEGRGRLKKKMRGHKGCLSLSREKRIASHFPPDSGLRWQLSTRSIIKSALNSWSASPAVTDSASTPAIGQAKAFSKCPWLAPSSIGSVNGESQLTPQRSWSHTPINFDGANVNREWMFLYGLQILFPRLRC